MGNKQTKNWLNSFGKSLLSALTLQLALAAQAWALPPIQLENLGRKIQYLGNRYDQGSNQTVFSYRFTQGLIPRPLSTLSFVIPKVVNAQALVRVDTPLSYQLSPGDSSASDILTLSNLPPILQSRTVDLRFAGRVGEGAIEVVDQVLPNVVGYRAVIGGPSLADVCLSIPKDAYCQSNPPPPPSVTPTPVPGIPSCLIDPALKLVARVGEALNYSFPVLNSNHSDVAVNCHNFPGSASCSVPSGGTIPSGQLLSINWTPGEADVGNGKVLPITLSADGNLIDCDVIINVLPDLPPVIITQLLPNPAPCAGLTTRLRLDGSASYDPEGLGLSAQWTTDCAGATLDQSAALTTDIVLSVPGTGVPQACSATLNVNDGKKSAVAQLSLNVGSCNTNCDDAQKDQCGVCNGNNLCLDCSGVPFGNKSVDRCGVCGGNNACVDCRGEVNGGNTTDICNVCGGDDTSCRSCTVNSLQDSLLALDGLARDRAAAIKQSLKGIKSKAGKKRAKSLLGQASALYTDSWTEIWSLSQNNVVCSHYAGCSAIQASSTLQSYDKNAAEFKSVALKAASVAAKYGGKKGKKLAASLRKKVKGSLFDTSVAVNSYPSSTYSCT